MNTIKSIILGLVVILSGQGHADTHHHGDPKAVHGMLVLGTQKVYFSHLPMFHSPHDYQAIVEVTMTPAVKKVYLKNKADHPQESVYTFEPQKFVLPDFLAKPFPIKGTLYQGHFERGGVPIAENVEVGVAQVIFSKKLNAQEVSTGFAEYMMFGIPGEYFMAHLIKGKPNFDHLAEVSFGETVAMSKPSMLLSFTELSEGPVENAVKESAVLHNTRVTLKVTTVKNIYLEFGDLEM